MDIELEKRFAAMVEVCNEIGTHEKRFNECEATIANYEERIQQCELPKIGKIVIAILAGAIINTVLMTLMPGIVRTLGLIYLFVLVATAAIAMQFVEQQYNGIRKKEKDICQSGIDEEKEKINGIFTEIRTIMILNQETFEGMPDEYWYGIAIVEMHKYVAHGRANTIPEAINLYEEQLHRWKLEEQNGMILDSQYRQEQRLENIEFYSSLSAYFNSYS